jgi:hypothetical protein
MFGLVVLLRFTHRKTHTRMCISRIIKENVLAILLLGIIYVQSSFPDISFLILFVFITGLLIGILHSFSLKIYFESNMTKITSRYLFALIFGASILLSQVSYLFIPSLSSISFIAVILCVGILWGMNVAIGARLAK